MHPSNGHGVPDMTVWLCGCRGVNRLRLTSGLLWFDLSYLLFRPDLFGFQSVDLESLSSFLFGVTLLQILLLLFPNGGAVDLFDLVGLVAVGLNWSFVSFLFLVALPGCLALQYSSST